MAIVPMQQAVPGQVALAAEYNKLIANILDLDSRITAQDFRTVDDQAERDSIAAAQGALIYRKDTNWLETYDGTAWRVVGVPAVSDYSGITDPYPGQLVVNTTDNMVYRWNGSAWVGSVALGGSTAATRHAAFYYATANQSIATGADRRVLFGGSLLTCDDVSAATVSGGTEFTVNRAGLWRVEYSVRFAAGVNDKERYAALVDSANPSVKYASDSAPSNTAQDALPISLGASKSVPLQAGAKLAVMVYQGDTNPVNVIPGEGYETSISLTWDGPLT